MQGAKHLTGLINARVRDHRPTASPPVAAATVRQFSPDSLTQLAELKAKGDLSPQEYEMLKSRIVQGSAEAG